MLVSYAEINVQVRNRRDMQQQTKSTADREITVMVQRVIEVAALLLSCGDEDSDRMAQIEIEQNKNAAGLTSQPRRPRHAAQR